jgi:hypothetical protein
VTGSLCVLNRYLRLSFRGIRPFFGGRRGICCFVALGQKQIPHFVRNDSHVMFIAVGLVPEAT